MIFVRCPSCAKDLKVNDELTGKKVKCPGCAQILVVPSPQTIAAPNVANERAAPPQPLASEQATLPPQASPSGSLPTNPSLSKPDATRSPNPNSDHDSSLTEFLAPKQSDDELGRLGDFRILKILGHGGMGVVFMGEDPKLGRRVAIKAMLPHLAQSKTSQQRFLREAKAAAALEHDHIVPIFHVGEDRGAPYIVMPFLQGEPLDKVMSREATLPLAEVLRIGREIARGLAAAHKRGLIHRDIKPANVWLEASDEEHAGRVKILDFGLARATAQEAGLTQQGTIIGTPAYMSPEQGRGDDVDGRCDLWALGVILYRMSTGQAPFVGKDTVSTLMAVAMNDPPAPITLRPELPQELSDLVMELLEKDLAKRLGTAAEVVQALTNIERTLSPGMTGVSSAVTTTQSGEMSRVSGRSSPTSTVPATGPSRGSARRVAFLAAALACITLLAAGIVFYFQTNNGIVRIEGNDPKVKVAIENVVPPPLMKDRWALQFDGSAHVEVTFAQKIMANDFTVEAWVVLDGEGSRKVGSTKTGHIYRPLNGHRGLACASGKETPPRWHWKGDVKAGRDIFRFSDEPCEFGKLTHVAGVCRGAKFTLYVNGREQNQGDPTPVKDDGEHWKFYLGGSPNIMTKSSGAPGSLVGKLFGFRLSRIARYDKDFTPQPRFTPDKDTIALYHMDEGSGDVLHDSSGNGHHGKIVGAKWVKTGGTPGTPIAPPPSKHDFALRFDGAGKVEVPVLGKLGKKAFTLEAWVYPDADLGKALATIVEVGGPAALLADPGTRSRSWRFRGWKQINAPMMADLTRPIHLAGVHVADLHQLLFVDGKLVASDKAASPSMMKIKQGRIGTRWRGFIREVRFSSVARYSQDFTPQQRFEPDKDTIALWHMDEGSGDKLTDSSGNGHHGKIVGAKWVKGKGGAD